MCCICCYPTHQCINAAAAAAACDDDDDDDVMTVQNNAIDILTKCDELRKQFMPMRWEVRRPARLCLSVS